MVTGGHPSRICGKRKVSGQCDARAVGRAITRDKGRNRRQLADLLGLELEELSLSQMGLLLGSLERFYGDVVQRRIGQIGGHCVVPVDHEVIKQTMEARDKLKGDFANEASPLATANVRGRTRS